MNNSKRFMNVIIEALQQDDVTQKLGDIAPDGGLDFFIIVYDRANKQLEHKRTEEDMVAAGEILQLLSTRLGAAAATKKQKVFH